MPRCSVTVFLPYRLTRHSLLNALIFVVMIICTTFIFVLLYKYRCLKVLFGWLMGSTGVLLALFGGSLI